MPTSDGQRVTCTRKLRWEAGHRIYGHESQCANFHGHSYLAEVTAEAVDPDAASLDDIGRVIDFSVLKAKIGTWIDENWDHAFILQMKDQIGHKALALVGKGQPVYTMFNPPTAECLAQHLLYDICPDLMRGTGVRVIRVTVHETANCFATAELGDDSDD